MSVDRRRFLRRSVGVPAGLITAPAALAWLASPRAAAAATSGEAGALAFVDDYTTNTTANLTPETNAAIRVLAGMQDVWKTGATWDSGVPLMPEVLRASMRYSARISRTRTDEEERQAFIYDRQHQSYAVIAGLGPLSGLYKEGAKAVTSITTAPDGTPATTISDSVPADAPAGSATGAGSVDSDLGKVAQLVNTVRGTYATSNPSKYSYQYPRPWRLTEDSEVVDTGVTDDLGYPVYESGVAVITQLLRQRSTTPSEDGGYPSGHVNAFHLAALGMAYAIPERFQELVARASYLSDTRIVAGMHSAVDVIGGRILATALAAAALYDTQNAELKAAARSQALAYFTAQTGTTADTLHSYAHSASTDTDPYADRAANARDVTPSLTYTLTRRARGGRDAAMTVPKGAEVLLETRLPYLDAEQRREVLRTTALPSGYVLLDGPELWGRLDLFTAADGYGAFERDVRVTMDAAEGGFSAADTWRNDIDGTGGLVKLGSGTLTLTGDNQYAGGTRVQAGTLTAGSGNALGNGSVEVRGGTLRLASAGGDGVRLRRSYAQSSGAVLAVTLHGNDAGAPALTVAHSATLARDSILDLTPDTDHRPTLGRAIPVIRASGGLRGEFGTIRVQNAAYRAVPLYTHTGLSVRLTAR